MKLKYDDAKHTYYLDGKRAKGVTTVAKTLDDSFALDQWRKRQVVVGMAITPTLVERAAAHFDDRGQLDTIADEAMRAAKAHEAAERGTAMHRIVERHILGEDVIDTDFSRAVRKAWDNALKSAGLEVVPEYAERIVVHPEHRICGKYDSLLRRRRDKKMVVADLKSGAGAVRYPHAIAVQLGLYANAQKMAERLPPEGGVTETFEDMPVVDKRWAYIVHMPEPELVEVVKVDIRAGWDAARNIIFPLLKWRDRKDLVQSVGTASVVNPNAAAEERRVAWVKGRIALIGMTEDPARSLLASRWPAGVAPKGPWTEDEVNALDAVLSGVERDCSVSFPEPDPALS